jgi:hypothetical protein
VTTEDAAAAAEAQGNTEVFIDLTPPRFNELTEAVLKPGPIQFSQGGPSITVTDTDKHKRHALQIGGGDPAKAVNDAEVESIQRQIDWTREHLLEMVDSQGRAKAGYESDAERMAMRLQSLLYAKAYQENIAIDRLRTKYATDEEQRAAALKREADWLDREAKERADNAIDREFGRLKFNL